jgi:surface carbohydrate biosynthesis protein
MTQPNSIALVVDNPKRDIRGVVLTAYHLLRMGCQAAIVPMYAQGYDIPLLAPDIVLLNYIRQGNAELASTYRKSGMRVAVMDTEGGILSRKGLREPNAWAQSMKDAGLSALVDRYFFWGEAVHQSFLANSGLAPEQMQITGCPRYDLCASPWNAMLSYRRDGFILVNTNFSAINPAFTKSGDAEKKIFRSLGWPDSYVDKWFREIEGVFPKYLDEVEALAHALPQQAIVVRPHPFENVKVYERRFAGIANIEIDGSGDVLNMIHAAKCIIHLNCGTSVDALLQRKVPVSLEYLNSDLLLDHTPLPSRLSLKPRSRKELVNVVQGLVDGTVEFDHDAAFAEIEPWFYRADGSASERVASALAAMPKGRTRSGVSEALRGGRPNPSVTQVLQGAAATMFGSRFVTGMRSKVTTSRRGKEIQPGDVQALLDHYAAASGGPRFRANSARTPLTGASMSTIEILPL